MNSNYNGWSNYETWLVNLWLSEFLQELDIDDVSTLADYIEEYLEENNPIKETSGLYVDLLTSALKEVNYREIAEDILDE